VGQTVFHWGGSFVGRFIIVYLFPRSVAASSGRWGRGRWGVRIGGVGCVWDGGGGEGGIGWDMVVGGGAGGRGE
jgi:hypothetical protein